MAIPLALDAVLVALFAYITWQAISIATRQYGGRFTSSGPYFAAGIGMLFVATLLNPVLTGGTFGLDIPSAFITGVLEVSAGFLLLHAAYDYYNIIYTTTVFEDDKL